MGIMRVLLWILIGFLLIFVVWRRYKRGKLMAVIWVLVGIMAAVYIGLGLTLFFVQSRILYQPLRDYTVTPQAVGADYEAVTLKTADGESLAAWYIPAGSEAKWTVLFCHGNAGNISHRLHTLELIHQLGLNCLIFDYRGYGQSTGRPTEKGTLLDAKAGWDWLVNEKAISPGSIIIFGRSLGGSIAAITAAEVHPGAVIIESAFTSFDDIARHFYPFLPVRLFTRFTYDTRSAVQSLSCPVLIVHSPDDELIPYKFGQALFEAADEPRQFAEIRGGHNEGFFENAQLYKQIWRDWLGFLEMADQADDDGPDAAVP